MLGPAEIGRAILAWRYALSRQEIRLLEYVVQGLANAEIAEHMGIREENTIKNRLRIVFHKLGVSNRVQAAGIAAHYGIGFKVTELSQ
jgi:DNA-binding NarL/FixJ family response regulator